MGLGVAVKKRYGPGFLFFMHKRGKEHYTENMRKTKAEKRKSKTK